MKNVSINIWRIFQESTVICFENKTKYQKLINGNSIIYSWISNIIQIITSNTHKKLMFHLTKLFFLYVEKLMWNLLLKCLILAIKRKTFMNFQLKNNLQNLKKNIRL